MKTRERKNRNPDQGRLSSTSDEPSELIRGCARLKDQSADTCRVNFDRGSEAVSMLYAIIL